MNCAKISAHSPDVRGVGLVALGLLLSILAADQGPLVGRIKELAATRVRYGYKRIHVLLKHSSERAGR